MIMYNPTKYDNDTRNHVKQCVAEALRIPKSLSNNTGINFETCQDLLVQIYFCGSTIDHEKLRYMLLCVLAGNKYYDPYNIWQHTNIAVLELLPWFIMTLSQDHYEVAHLIPWNFSNLPLLLAL